MGDWQNDQLGMCSGIHFRPEASIEACIGTPLSIFGHQALFPCLSTILKEERMIDKRRKCHTGRTVVIKEVASMYGHHVHQFLY